jgi:tetratricopeptide (TPR) repeat protein
MQSTAVHTTENGPAPTPAADGSPTKWTQSGNPIDTAKFDGMIDVTQKALKAKPADESTKNSAAQAYFDRGFALTEARQYASALGDYRKALKIDPNHEESKKWIEQIIGIYSMMKKDYPKEGEEPPALPFKSEKDKGAL